MSQIAILTSSTKKTRQGLITLPWPNMTPWLKLEISREKPIRFFLGGIQCLGMSWGRGGSLRYCGGLCGEIPAWLGVCLFVKFRCFFDSETVWKISQAHLSSSASNDVVKKHKSTKSLLPEQSGLVDGTIWGDRDMVIGAGCFKDVLCSSLLREMIQFD